MKTIAENIACFVVTVTLLFLPVIGPAVIAALVQ
jgi:hypothetical protein